MIRLLEGAHGHLDKTTTLDFIAPFLLRMFLVPVFLMAGLQKFQYIDNTASFFGQLGIPFPELMAYVAASTEIVGAVFLLIGFAVRWISIPLIFTMFVAIFTVHWDSGWAAIAPDTTEAAMRLGRFMDWLQTNYPQWYQDINQGGTPVILQSGIEYGASYIVMLFALFFYGAGKYISMDYWIKERKFVPAIVTGVVLGGIFTVLRYLLPDYM